MLGSELLHQDRGVGQGCTFPVVVGVVAAFVATQVSAEEPIRIEPIVVTASGHEQVIKDAPASISVITRETLESHQYKNITDALRDVPGVIVTGGGAGDTGADISIRGMSSSYTLILVNGQRVDSRESRPNGSAGFEQNWLPPLQAIERIEVVRGPMSTLYGSDAIGGVINVITRKVPQKLEGAFQADALLQQDNASGNAYQTNFYLAAPLSEDLVGLQLYGQYSTREEDEILNGFEEREHKSVTARLTLTPTPDHDLTLEAGVSEQHREGTVGNTGATTGCRGACVDSDNTYTNTHFSLAHSGRFAFGNTDSHIKREISDNQSRDIEITNTTVKTSLWMPFGDHLVTVGGNYGLEELDDSTTNQISDRTKAEMAQYAAFAEDEWLVLSDLSLTGGVRMDFNEDYGANLSPRVYANWNVTDNWTLKGGVSTGYRSPSLRETTPDWGQTSRGGNIYGNPDLEPETSLSKEIGVIYSSPSGIEASFTVFHNAFKDKITRITCPTTICSDGANQFGADP
ncbi:TonB-dependent receptor, partial [Nisaea sp.]